jgi:hypothetical protein
MRHVPSTLGSSGSTPIYFSGIILLAYKATTRPLYRRPAMLRENSTIDPTLGLQAMMPRPVPRRRAGWGRLEEDRREETHEHVRGTDAALGEYL